MEVKSSSLYELLSAEYMHFLFLCICYLHVWSMRTFLAFVHLGKGV
jgi:hypothetical protein